MEKYFVVVNPNAGNKKGEADWPLIKSLLDEFGIKHDFYFTRYRHDAIITVNRKVLEGYDKFIAIGGDGTLNEVVNGIFFSGKAKANTRLGAVMIGTGNDWGRMFNIPSEYRMAVAAIKNNMIFRQDVGKVTYFLGKKPHSRYFINTAGLGFDALVVKNTNIAKDKGASNKFSYLKTLFTTLMGYRKLDISINIDEKHLPGKELFTMSIGIGKFSGGGMMQVPDALADDGLFDVMLVNKISKLKIIRKIKTLYNGKIGTLKEVNLLKANKIVVNSKEKVMLEVDGESLGHNPFEFEIIDQKLNVIVN